MLFGTISGGITAELTGEGEALRKCPVDIFSERASMRRERQGAQDEIGIEGTPYNYSTWEFSISYKNPGYLIGTNIK